MTWLTELLRRFSYLKRRSHFEQELDAEVQFHIETRADELELSGMARRDSLAQARREFGSSARLREDSRSAWQIHWLEDLVADLRYAVRALRHSPGFAAAAIFSLALGIGANTTIFSFTMEFLFSTPSAHKPESLVRVQIGGNSHAPMATYRFVRDAHIFEGLAGLREEGEANFSNGDQTFKLWTAPVTTNFFEIVGVPVARGRAMRAGDGDVVVLSHSMWQNRMGGDPETIGRTILLDGRPYTVVGILPRDHRTLTGFGFSPDLYRPAHEGSDKEIVALIARLPEGMSRRVALARLAAIGTEYPGGKSRWPNSFRVDSVEGLDRLQLLGFLPLAAFFGMLMAVVGLVLLIACTNVASLLLARASSRRQEFAIRLAIGASRGRVIRQLLTESLLLAVLGTASGLVLNIWTTAAINRIQFPLALPIQILIEPDRRLLLYSAALALVSALICGLLPAPKSTRANLNLALHAGDWHAAGKSWGLRNALVAGQLALSTMLLGTGFLFLNNLIRASSMNPGFDVHQTVWAYMRVVLERYPVAEKTIALTTTALDRLRSLPGVEAASIATRVPLTASASAMTGADVQTDISDERFGVGYRDNRIGPDYFRTMNIPLVAGREFLPSDRKGAPEVVILNENFAQRCFGALNPVGHTIRFGTGKPIEVVGVAKNSKYVTPGEGTELALYAPYFQSGGVIVNLNFMIRAVGEPESLVKAVRASMGDLDRSAAIDVKLMRNSLGFALLPSRVGAAVMGSMGLLGLALASIGLYGVLAYAVSRRLREIGVRMALGAAPADILRLVARQSLFLWIAGVVIGTGLALLATQPLAMFLVPGLSPADPLTFLAAIAVLGVVAALATLGPALRALRVDPVTALRWE
jgi:predicted permease